MKKLFTLLTMLIVGIASSWGGYYRPTKRVTSFDSEKMYMLYNTCIDGSEDRTGFIYVNGNGSMQKYTGTNRNPKQFTTSSTAYLWKVVTGDNNHISLQNVSNSKYYGYRLGKNDSDPNNLYLYPWGEYTSGQAGANSQNEDDPSQTTANANITFDSNKVFIIGNKDAEGSNTQFWNGNPGDIVTWSAGHPFAFYEVEETYNVTYTITDPSGATLTGTYEGWENADPSFSGMGYTLTDKTWTKGEGNTATFTAKLSFTDNLPFNVSNMSAGGTKNFYTIYGFTSARYWYSNGTDIKSATSAPTNVAYAWAICSSIENEVLGFKIFNMKTGSYVTGSTPNQDLSLGDGTTYVYGATGINNGNGFMIYNTNPKDLISFTSSNAGTKLSIWTKANNTHVGSNLTFTPTSTIYSVTDTETLSEIDNYSDYGIIYIPSGSTLNVDIDNFDLTKFYGPGTIVLDADNNSLTGGTNKSTVATGKLTIKEGKTLTIGTGDKQAHSIESFTSIELAGTIKHQNSKATLNNVTVPTGKTGKIFAFDMGSDPDGFKLAGTTTLNGDLTVCSRWNFQMKVEELDGSGTWLICGTNGDNFDAEGTSSQEAAVIKVGSSPKFTGTIHEANSNSQLSVIGTLKNCTLKGTQAPDGYPQLADGAVLDGVVLEGDKRIGTTGNVTIKDLAGNNLSGTSYSYAFIGSGTLNFEGTCDLTKKSDGTTASTCSKIGYPSGNNIVIKTDATVTASDIYNSSGNNAAITVEGTISATFFGGVSTLAEGSTTTLSDGTPFDGAVTVSGDATLNLTAATAALNKSITVAEDKTLTINGGSNTVNLTGGISGAGNIVLSYFPTAATHPNLTDTDWTGTIEFPSPTSGQTDLAAIFNVWGNTNSTIKLHSVSGWLPGGDVNPTLNIMEAQTLTINNGSSGTTPVLKKITGAGILEQTWTGGNNYTLKIETLTGFTGTLKGTNKPIVVNKLFVSEPPMANALLIKTYGTVSLSNLYFGLQKTTAYTWETKTLNEVLGIYVSDIDQLQLRKDVAVNIVAPYFSLIGPGVGKYNVSLGQTSYTDINDFANAVSAWTKVDDYVAPSVAINQPTNAFYRIKAGDKYLQDARKSDSATQRTLTDAAGANESAETIFYLDYNKFIGYKTGYGFGYSVCQTQDTEQLNTQLFTESAEMGKYTIQSQQGTCTSADDNEGYWGVDGSDLSREDDAASGACWTLEPATSVPVTFKKAGLGYATFFTPVALQIPDETNAYVCKLQESGSNAYTLTFYEITAIKDESNHTTIPANTAVLLYRSGVKDGEEDVVVNFPITTCKDEEGEDVVITENSFYGTLATKAFNPNSTVEDIYSLRTYLKEDQAVKVGFYKKTTGTTCAGFKAWIKTDHPVNDEVRNIIISFDGVDDPTGIVEALGLEDANVEIYDLNGRKMATYKKGINIVNGKKVLVK